MWTLVLSLTSCPASVNADMLYPMRTSVGSGDDTGLVLGLPVGVFDMPSATRMMMSAGAIPCRRSKIHEMIPKTCDDLTYVYLHGDHANDALRGVVNGEEDNKDELHD